MGPNRMTSMSHAHEPPAAERSVHRELDALAAPPLPVAANPLDSLVAESPPEHSLMGQGLVWAFYASAAVTVATFGYRTLAWENWDAGNPVFWVLLVILLLELWVARGIQTFSRSGWGLGLLVIAIVIFGGMTTALDSETLLQSLVGCGAVVLGGTWIKYLLDRRSDFT